MHIRKYQAGEEEELWNLFFHTIHTVNCRDYTEEQVQAWAPNEADKEKWRQRIAGMNPWVCIHEETIVGYAGLLKSGYVDHFYVHHAWQGQGVGKQLYKKMEEEAVALQLHELTSDVSITARPFFELQGFQVVTPQEVKLGNVVLINFKMRKQMKSV